MEGKLLHRIFIGVEIPIPPPPDPLEGFVLCQENEDFILNERNLYLTPENE